MDASTLLQIPQVQQILAQVPANERQAILDLIGTAASAAATQAGTPTQRTDLRRQMGVPAQRFKLWNAYFSVVRFSGTVSTGGGNTTVTWTGGNEQRPFSYRIGDPLSTAGFPSTFGNATQADTSIVKASETNAGEQVMVHGISMMPSLTTDPGAWNWLGDNISIVISMDGDARRYRLGRPYMIPASGGNYGGIGTSVVTPVQTGTWSNGVPDIANYYPFPEPMLWSSSGETDSNFNVVIRLERTVALTAATVAGSSPVTSGTDVGAFVDYIARLHTSQTGNRSLNQ